MCLFLLSVVGVLQHHEGECQHFPLRCEACEKNNIPRYKVPNYSCLDNSLLVLWNHLSFFTKGKKEKEKKSPVKEVYKKASSEGSVQKIF